MALSPLLLGGRNCITVKSFLGPGLDFQASYCRAVFWKWQCLKWQPGPGLIGRVTKVPESLGAGAG